jgi:mannose-6-phosphate isomerase-like protein (cupin superfamily)
MASDNGNGNGEKRLDYHGQKNRVFVRGIEGEYNLTQELARLRSLPRVIKGRETPFHSGPQQFSKHYMEPKDGLGQTLHIHLEEYSPGGKSQKHGHVNEAVFYILDGEGAEIHDGIRYEWEAGDAAIVHNNCVHQHFNRNPDRPARALVMKTKPMCLFMNMLFQKMIEKTPSEPTPTQGDFRPREEPLHDHDHDHDHDHEHHHIHEHAHGD